MADLSNLIYTAVWSEPQQPGDVAGPPAHRPRLPCPAETLGGLAPLLSILALSLVLLIGCAVAGHLTAGHEPRPGLAQRTAPMSHKDMARHPLRGYGVACMPGFHSDVQSAHCAEARSFYQDTSARMGL